MSSLLIRELPLLYAALSEGRRCGAVRAVHEPSPAPRRTSTSPVATAARATPRRRSPGSTRRIRLHLKPGQKGTKQLVEQYGDRLICVRYRYDPERKKRLKTVELLVGERDWEPPAPRFAHDDVVGLRVALAEVAVRNRVKQAGGVWDPERRVWRLPYGRVVALGLTSRIVTEPASTGRCRSSNAEHLPADARPASR